MGFIHKESGEWIRHPDILKHHYRRLYIDPYTHPQIPSTGGIINELAAAALFSAIAVDNYTNKNDIPGAIANAALALLFVKYTARQSAVYFKEYFNP
jgi:hypothetical protein